MRQHQFDFVSFGGASLYPGEYATETRGRRFLVKYKIEIAAILVALRRAKAIGQNGRPTEVPDNCDRCEAGFIDLGLYFDCATGGEDLGPWSNLCFDCFADAGNGIGWGIGQMYFHDGDGWQCIGGGDPSPTEETE